MNDRALAEDLKYKAAFEELDESSNKACYMKPFEIKTDIQMRLEELLREIGLAGKARVVDLCGGSGHVAYHLQKEWKDICIDNIDLNKSALDACRQMNGVRVKCYERSCYDSGLQGGEYDMAICWLSFFHLSSPQGLINEMHRLLKPGGLGIISTYLNMDHDIDIRASLIEAAREGDKREYKRNIYSRLTFERFTQDKSGVPRFDIVMHKIKLSSRLNKTRGIGTYNRDAEGREIEPRSGGLLVPMYLIELRKI